MSETNAITKYIKLDKFELETNIRLAKKGNDEAFKALLCHLHKYLQHLQTEFFIQGSDAEDVYQEASIKLMNVIATYDSSKGSFTSFAQSSIRKHIITSINREMAQKRTILNKSHSLNNLIGSEDGEATTEFIDNLPDTDTSFSQVEIIQRDYEQYLINEISSVLSELESNVFYLRFIEHLTYREIATNLGLFKISKTKKKIADNKAVDNAIMRSRPKIKKVLESLGLGPHDFDKTLDDFRYAVDLDKFVGTDKVDKKIVKKKMEKSLRKK